MWRKGCAVGAGVGREGDEGFGTMGRPLKQRE